jgi:hypothetical protein
MGHWDRAGDLVERTRELAGSTCAQALSFVADWADAMRLAAEGRTEPALAVGGAATAALAVHGERYNAARLTTDLLARLGDAAPAEVIARTAHSLDAMGARTSAAAARAMAYAPDAGA